MIVYGHDAAVARWAGERLGIANWGPCTAIGIVRDDRLVGAAVFNNFVWPNIEISFVTTTRHWGTPQCVRAIIGYPFLQLGCKRITSTTHEDNRPTRAFLLRMGFRQEGLHIDALPDGNAVSYGLLRRDAERWLTDAPRRTQLDIAA